MADDRQVTRMKYLRALDQKSQDEPYAHWEPDKLVDGYTDTQVQDALRYLEEKGYAEIHHSIGDRGLAPARITASGQDFLNTQARALSSMFNPHPGGLIQRPVTRDPLTISRDLGHAVADGRTLRTAADAKQSCFVIMPFQEPITSYYTHIIKPAVVEAGLVCVRADEITKPGAIIEQIWTGIQNAAVCVAELTGQRPNVMYELGLAHAVRKPVVSLVQTMDDIPFDLKHLRHIVYSTSIVSWEVKLRTDLKSMLMAALFDPTASLAFK